MRDGGGRRPRWPVRDGPAFRMSWAVVVVRSDLTMAGGDRIFFVLMPMIACARAHTAARPWLMHLVTPHILGVCRSTFLRRPWSQQ